MKLLARRRSKSMKSVCALILALVLCSCAKVTVSDGGGGEVVKPVRQLTEKEKIGLLRTEAAKRGMHWKIFCTSTYTDEPESYQGVAAWTEQSLSAVYEDDGLTDEWMKGNQPTQADAALALYYAIQGPPTHPVKKWGQRPNDGNRKMRQCTERALYSDHPDANNF